MRVYQFRHIRAEGQCSRATMPGRRRYRVKLHRFALVLSAILGSLVLLAAAGCRRAVTHRERLVEVVVTLPQPPLAVAIQHDRRLARARRQTAG